MATPESPVLKAFSDVLAAAGAQSLPDLASTADETKERDRAYALTEFALHVAAPAAVPSQAAFLESVVLDDGPAGGERTGAVGHQAWQALGQVETTARSKKAVREAWSGLPGELTGLTGSTSADTDIERWERWAARAATWAARGAVLPAAVTLLGQLAVA